MTLESNRSGFLVKPVVCWLRTRWFRLFFLSFNSTSKGYLMSTTSDNLRQCHFLRAVAEWIFKQLTKLRRWVRARKKKKRGGGHEKKCSLLIFNWKIRLIATRNVCHIERIRNFLMQKWTVDIKPYVVLYGRATNAITVKRKNGRSIFSSQSWKPRPDL